LINIDNSQVFLVIANEILGLVGIINLLLKAVNLGVCKSIVVVSAIASFISKLLGAINLLLF
jgi:hypothetical protein